MSLVLKLDTGAAPQSGAESMNISSPATHSAFQTAAATAMSSQGGFIEVTVEPPTGTGETQLINLSKIKAVI